MRARRVGILLALAALTAGAPGRRAAADPKGVVVARVGQATITSDELEERMRAIPPFQLAALGQTTDEIRRNILERIMIPELLYTLGGRARKLEESAAIHERVDSILRKARVDALESEVAVSPEDVARFYAENKGRFEAPERIKLWRILVKTREEAAKVLDEARQNGGPQRWNDLAREHSLDRATALRAGDLGLIAPDGTSNEPSVRVDPGLFAAAVRIKDGELVPEPVPEKDGFAVVWRRGSMPAVRRTLEEESTAIRQVLARQRLEQSSKALLEKLRRDKNVQKNPQLIDLLEIDSSGSVAPKTRPGVVPHKPAGSPVPAQTLRGLR
jgi:peptidyl-prolyl cis-trans isomerase C